MDEIKALDLRNKGRFFYQNKPISQGNNLSLEEIISEYSNQFSFFQSLEYERRMILEKDEKRLTDEGVIAAIHTELRAKIPSLENAMAEMAVDPILSVEFRKLCETTPDCLALISSIINGTTKQLLTKFQESQLVLKKLGYLNHNDNFSPTMNRDEHYPELRKRIIQKWRSQPEAEKRALEFKDIEKQLRQKVEASIMDRWK